MEKAQQFHKRTEIDNGGRMDNGESRHIAQHHFYNWACHFNIYNTA